MRIAIDIDSTLHHYWDQFAAIALDLHGVELPYADQAKWSENGLTPEQSAAVIARTHEAEHVLAAVPYPGAVEAVRRWHQAGHWLHITSHRAAEAHAPTAQWLDQVGLPYDDLHCSFDKIPRCVELGIELLVDDSPVNIRRAHEQGILVATLEHPWNVEVCRELGPDAVVCGQDWPALEHALEPFLTTGARST